MGYALLTCLELLVAAAIIIGFINEKKLIEFEDGLALLLKKFLKRRIHNRSFQVKKMTQAKRCA